MIQFSKLLLEISFFQGGLEITHLLEQRSSNVTFWKGKFPMFWTSKGRIRLYIFGTVDSLNFVINECNPSFVILGKKLMEFYKEHTAIQKDPFFHLEVLKMEITIFSGAKRIMITTLLPRFQKWFLLKLVHAHWWFFSVFVQCTKRNRKHQYFDFY